MLRKSALKLNVRFLQGFDNILSCSGMNHLQFESACLLVYACNGMAWEGMVGHGMVKYGVWFFVAPGTVLCAEALPRAA